MSDLEITEIVEILPVIPAEHTIDDFWKELSVQIQARGNIRETVFDLWSAKMAADSIMKVTGLTEDELDAIIPRSRWVASKWIRCSKCGGRGGYSTIVPWDKR